MTDVLARWLSALVTDVAPHDPVARGGLSPAEALVRRTTPSGADLALAGDVVVKVHHPRTDAGSLAARLRAVSDAPLSTVWVRPLEDEPRTAPDGRAVTLWPRVDVLAETSPGLPWAGAGRLLAVLHRTPTDRPTTDALPPQGGPARLERALDRAKALDHHARTLLVDLATRLLHDLGATRHTSAPTVVHGDWHLGQLASTHDGLRLLDVDDVGLGDPAWDLGRPAGFWAAGVLDDGAWRTFLDAYRDAGGPAVPATGDPWPPLDLPARSAVLVAAVRAVSVQPVHSADPAHALLEACARM